MQFSVRFRETRRSGVSMKEEARYSDLPTTRLALLCRISEIPHHFQVPQYDVLLAEV